MIEDIAVYSMVGGGLFAVSIAAYYAAYTIFLERKDKLERNYSNRNADK